MKLDENLLDSNLPKVESLDLLDGDPGVFDPSVLESYDKFVTENEEEFNHLSERAIRASINFKKGEF